MPQVGAAHRPVAYGYHGLVASAHAQASLIGIETLKAGGNAVDAAVAVNGILAVVQPHMCGLGGDLFCLLFHAPSGKVVFLNGAGRSGARASVSALRGRGLSAVPLMSPLAVTVPGCADAWGALLARYGTRPLTELLKPAITLAADGFPTSALLARTIQERATEIQDPEWHEIYLPRGRAPHPGARLCQPSLARSLARIAEEGPEALYRGDLAARIVRHVEGGGGFLTPEDLAGHAGRWQVPISTTYRDARVYGTPPPTQGVTLLQALNLLEATDLARLAHQSAEHLHLLVEAVKVAYADRDRYIGDPDHVPVPVTALLDKAYADRRRAQIDPRRAATHIPWGSLSGDTTGFVVADAGGSVIAVTQSLYSAFGSGVVPPGTGITLHSRGAAFSLDPESPNALGPRKQPFHTLMAALVVREGRPAAALATMGAHGQPQTQLQVLTNLLDYGMNPQEAIECPRFVQGRMRHTDRDGLLRIERRVPPSVRAVLRRRGHPLEVVEGWSGSMGHAQALTAHPRAGEGLLAGGADPRGDGLALAY